MLVLKFKGLRLKIVLLVFMVTLVVALSIQYLSYEKRVIEPIVRVFSEIEGVNEIEANRQRSGIKLIISLDNLIRFEQVMQEILAQAEEFGLLSQIEFKDNANDKLEKVYHAMHYAIWQAVEKGDFSQMGVIASDIAKENNVEQNIYIEHDYVFVQLLDKDNYFYQIIGRHQQPTAVRFDRASKGGLNEGVN